MVADDLNRFLHTPAAGDNIFRDKEPLARLDLKTTAQHESAVAILLGKDVTLAQMAGHFLADNDPADGGGYHGCRLMDIQLIREPTADLRGNGGILEQEGALKKLAAVEPASEDEMPVEQRTSLAEKIENFIHRIAFVAQDPEVRRRNRQRKNRPVRTIHGRKPTHTPTVPQPIGNARM